MGKQNRLRHPEPEAPEYVWIVYDWCMCEDSGCYGKAEIKVFVREQTAIQEADLRSKRYGGLGEVHQHMDKVPISTKISGY
jgi:hypothetical protein